MAEEQEDTAHPWNGHSFFASVGYSIIVSDIYSTWTSGDPHSGFDWQAGYTWISKRNIGAGFLYEGYYTHGSEVVPTGGWSSAHVDENLYVNYLAPQFVGTVILGNGKWCLNYAAGIGFAMMTQSGWATDVKGDSDRSSLMMRFSEYGWGTNVSFGIEYRSSRQFGITASLSCLNSYISQNLDNYILPNSVDKDKTTGFTRISLDIGLRFHL